MNLKKIIIGFIFYTLSLLQASDHENIILPVAEQENSIARQAMTRSLTPETLRIHQERQSMIVASEPYKIEVSTDDALRVALAQIFLYGQNKYKKVTFQDFYTTHPEVIESFIEHIQATSSLDYQVQGHIFDRYTQIPEEDRDLPASREIACYKIVGAQPFKDGFYDALYDVTTAKDRMQELARHFIRANYKDVRKVCTPLRQSQTSSTKVVCVPCCQKTFHKKCIIACQFHNVSSCPNTHCQQAENGVYFSKPWSKSFYEQALQVQPLLRKDIPSGTCSLCEDSLKNETPIRSLTIPKKAVIIDAPKDK